MGLPKDCVVPAQIGHSVKNRVPYQRAVAYDYIAARVITVFLRRLGWRARGGHDRHVRPSRYQQVGRVEPSDVGLTTATVTDGRPYAATKCTSDTVEVEIRVGAHI